MMGIVKSVHHEVGETAGDRYVDWDIDVRARRNLRNSQRVGVTDQASAKRPAAKMPLL